MPRALTDQEKCRQCRRLLERGKAVVLAQGIRKVSVDDITKAAGMAKGSFYQHFESKEQYLCELIWNIHRQFFAQVERMIQDKSDLRANFRSFLINVFHIPEVAFFIHHDHDINELFASMPDQERHSVTQMEVQVYERLLNLAGIDTERVKPGVVHNYLHSLFLMRGSELMIADDLSETFEWMLNGLMSYIFGGA